MGKSASKLLNIKQYVALEILYKNQMYRNAFILIFFFLVVVAYVNFFNLFGKKNKTLKRSLAGWLIAISVNGRSYWQVDRVYTQQESTTSK